MSTSIYVVCIPCEYAVGRVKSEYKHEWHGSKASGADNGNNVRTRARA